MKRKCCEPGGSAKLRADRWLGLVDIQAGELGVLGWSCAYFFTLLASLYILRPVRDALGAAGGTADLTWLYTGTLAGTLLLNPCFSALVSRFPRRVFIPIVHHFLTLNLIVFYLLLSALTPAVRVNAGRAFFIWMSVINLFVISLFWGFMADIFRSEQGKRLFGFIGVGGTLGAIAGAAVTTLAAEAIGPMPLLLLAAFLLECSVFCVRGLVRTFGEGRTAQTSPSADPVAALPPGHGALSGLRRVVGSPYLLGICLFLGFYSISSTFIYFEQARIVKATFADAGQRTAFFARIDLLVNLLTVITQCFLSGRIIPAIGVGSTLSLLPALTLTGLFWLAAAPVAPVLLVFQVIRRAAEYALVRPAREVLFTVVSREEKYSSKSFIDTFVYRGGDALGAWSDRWLTSSGIGAAGLAWIFVPFAVVWAGTGLLLGLRQGQLGQARGTTVG